MTQRPDPLTPETYVKLRRGIDMSPGCLWHCPASIAELFAGLGIGLALLLAGISLLGKASRRTRAIGWLGTVLGVAWNLGMIRSIVVEGLTFEPRSFDRWGIGAEGPIAFAWAFVVVLLLRTGWRRWRTAPRPAG